LFLVSSRESAIKALPTKPISAMKIDAQINKGTMNCISLLSSSLQKSLESVDNNLGELDLWRFLQEHFQGQETLDQIELLVG
jgi:hypothetical protein